MYDHVTPFLKRTNSSMSNCSLRDGLMDSSFFVVSLGALVTTFHSQWWSGKYFNCLAGWDYLFGCSCSAHLKTT